MSLFQLKISLDHIKPEIWRRVLVSSKTSLYNLHHIIQFAMGWENAHLYEFNRGDSRFGDLRLWNVDRDTSIYVIDDKATPITALLTKDYTTLQYTYDIGDNWEHTIHLEKIIKDSKIKLPICSDGQRSCPPEDCGGVLGYYQLIEEIKLAETPEAYKYLQLIGKEYDPEYFSINRTNQAFKVMKKFIKEYEAGFYEE